MQPDNTTRVCSNIREKLTQLSMAQSECTIYRVHRHLRSVNDKAYEPEVIAIGPYHRDKDNLKMMEEHKLRYLQSLLRHKNENLERYVSVIEPLEEQARKCYAEPISLNPSEFIEMLVLDGCFIIDLVRKCNMEHLREKNDPIFHMDWIMNSLQRDLMLFENQIPFFVVCKLFDMIEVANQHERLMHLLLRFFNNLYPGKVYRKSTNRSSSHEIKHLLHLIHNNWLPSQDQLGFSVDERDKRKRWRFINSATWLREANVKFEKKEVVTLFDIRFEKGTIYLAPLTIEDRTESFLRNLIAYEQYFQGSQCNFVTDYVKFLDCLIDSSRDVEILSRYGIIDNWLGDDEVVANMFNKLTDSVTGPGKLFIYAKIFDNVKIHCNKRRNKWMAKLRTNYLNSPWAVISIVAAVVLLLLTIAQTVCSVLQVV
ncbi:hypothetical protein BUALT_Bualt14G0033300 [Buddleja alternifolia]|uniref:Uncharacterized protein n=1 Tax=Buddleja alternifolia TaxID=168488 RepID=A0AAV6WMH1_9LAMI|nr:hypothetical protein BUALT_Bualt14G0033300 [Buddleja alternifolia]